MSEPDAGGEPPDEEPEPPAEAVGFSDVFPILQVNCGNCHGGVGLPAFAQADEDAAYAVTQDDAFYERIIVRAVTLRTMPPMCAGGALGTGVCLSEDEAALLEEWVEQGALP